MDKEKILDIVFISSLLLLSFILVRNIIFFNKTLIIGSLPVNPLRDYYRHGFSWDYFYNLGSYREKIGPVLLKNLFYLPFYKLFGLENFGKSILYLSVFLTPIILFLGMKYILKYDSYSSFISSLIFSYNGIIYSSVNSLEISGLISYMFFPLSIFLLIKGIIDKKIHFLIFAFIIAGLSSYTLILEGWIFLISSLLFSITSYFFDKDKKIIILYFLFIPFLFLSNPFLFSISPRIISNIKTYQLMLLIGEHTNLDEIRFLILIVLPFLAMIGLFEHSLDLRYRLYSLMLWLVGLFLIYYFPIKIPISSLIAFSYAILVPYGLKKFYSIASYIEKIVIEVEDEETEKVTKYVFDLLFNLKEYRLNILGIILLSIISLIMIFPLTQNIALGAMPPTYSETEYSHIIRGICNSDFSSYRVLLLGKDKDSIIYKEFGTYCSCPLILYPSPLSIENVNLSNFIRYTLSLNSSFALELLRILGVKYIVVEKGVDYPFIHYLEPYFKDKELTIFLVNNTVDKILAYQNVMMSYEDLSIIQTMNTLNISPIEVPLIMFKDLNELQEYKSKGLLILNNFMFYSLILNKYNILSSNVFKLDNETYNCLLLHGIISPNGLLIKKGERYNFTFYSEGENYEIWAKIVFWRNGGLLRIGIDNTSSMVSTYDKKYNVKWVRLGSLFLSNGKHNISLTGIKNKNLILSFSIIKEEEFREREKLLAELFKNNSFIIVYDFERMDGTGFIEQKYSNTSLGYLAHCKGGYVCSFMKELYIPKTGKYYVYLRLSNTPKKSSIVRIVLDKYLLSLHHNLSERYGLYFAYLGSYNFNEGIHRFELHTKTIEYGVSKDYDMLLISPTKLENISKIFVSNRRNVSWVALSPEEYKLSVHNSSFIIFSESYNEKWRINSFDHFRVYDIINGYYIVSGEHYISFSAKKNENYLIPIILGYLYIAIIIILLYLFYKKKNLFRKRLS